jgi:hypothetical protein
MITDHVCIDKDIQETCVNDFGFFEVRSQSGLDGLDGILGMSPTGRGNGPNFVHEVYKAGNISEPTVSFWLNDADSDVGSYVTFGGVQTKAYKGDIYYSNTLSDSSSWWTLTYSGIKYGSDSYDVSSVGRIIVDTGTSFIYLPQSDYTKLANKLEEAGFNCF